MHQTWKVFLACALGAGVGSLVALELNPWLWWVGLIVGGLTGYLSYEWHAVQNAVVSETREIRLALHAEFQIQRLRHAVWFVILGGQITIYFFSVSVLLMLVAVELVKLDPAWLGPPAIVFGWGPGVMLGFVGLVVPFITVMLTGPVTSHSSWLQSAIATTRREWHKYEADLARELSFKLLPPVLAVAAIRLAAKKLAVVRSQVPVVARRAYSVAPAAIAGSIKYLRRAIWSIFVQIHSELRLLCGLDAAFGAGIGYLMGSAIIGATAGGMLGVLNYAVITERWLKPAGYISVPARQNE